MTKSLIKPLFIWAGGKNKMLKHYKPLIPDKFDAYYEPFLGGGAMFIHVHDRAKRFYLNDINQDIIKIYNMIQSPKVNDFLSELDIICNEYLSLPKEGRYKLFFDTRNDNAFHSHNWNEEKSAAIMYFLLKTCFNGIYQVNKNTGGKFGTPCGLLNQKDKVYDKQNVLQWHEILQKAVITCTDWREVCECEDNAFYFLDPPYRGCFTSYGEDFDDDKQIELINFAKSVPPTSYVMLCNRDIGDGFFEAMKSNLHLEKFDVTYTAGRRKRVDNGFEAKKAREVLLHNI